MPPLPTISGSNLPGVELPGDSVEACIACRLDVPNDRQDIGREVRRLRLRATWGRLLFADRSDRAAATSTGMLHYQNGF
jgi:hypothetical protein